MGVYAVDAGGTRIKLGIVEQGVVVARSFIESRSDQELSLALPRIATALRQLSPKGESLDGIAMAFPSLINGDYVVGDVGKFADAENILLPRWADKEFGLPFAIENDARMAVIGEWKYGAGIEFDNIVMITLGTGIGTGVISEGRVLRGGHGAAGVLGGHMTARIEGRECACGNIGCWEAEASTAALGEMANEMKADVAFPLDYQNVFANAEAGNGIAIELRERSLAVWSALTVSLIHAYDPEMVILGGGVMASGAAILEPIQEYVHQFAWTPYGPPKMVCSQLGDDAALLACEWLLKSKGKVA